MELENDIIWTGLKGLVILKLEFISCRKYSPVAYHISIYWHNFSTACTFPYSI